MRWVGALEVVGPSDDERDIWSFADFPARLAVKPLVMLDPEHGVPMSELEGKVVHKGPAAFANPDCAFRLRGGNAGRAG